MTGVDCGKVLSIISVLLHFLSPTHSLHQEKPPKSSTHCSAIQPLQSQLTKFTCLNNFIWLN